MDRILGFHCHGLGSVRGPGMRPSKPHSAAKKYTHSKLPALDQEPITVRDLISLIPFGICEQTFRSYYVSQ